LRGRWEKKADAPAKQKSSRPAARAESGLQNFWNTRERGIVGKGKVKQKETIFFFGSFRTEGKWDQKDKKRSRNGGVQSSPQYLEIKMGPHEAGRIEEYMAGKGKTVISSKRETRKSLGRGGTLRSQGLEKGHQQTNGGQLTSSPLPTSKKLPERGRATEGRARRTKI